MTLAKLTDVIGLYLNPPDQAIVLDSILTGVERGDLDHRQRTDPRVELAPETVLLQHGL